MVIITLTKEQGHRTNILKLLQNKHNDASNKSQQLRNTILNQIAQTYGYETAEKVNLKNIWVGMNNTLLLASWGKADYITQGLYKQNICEQWYYKQINNKSNSFVNKIEIVLVNNIIVGWKEII